MNHTIMQNFITFDKKPDDLTDADDKDDKDMESKKNK